ncbi:MAG: hypothetical protein JNK46_19135 [Methylobacteriaceae bacterium]|nr:hypothetical protein [Methylobacteriaceae bacterium]
MTLPTPKQFLDRYTDLFFFSPTLGIYDMTHITSYGSGWGHDASANRPTGYLSQQEYNGPFKRALRFALDPARHGDYGSVFRFGDASPLRDTFRGEPFYRNGVIRAFLGKGSPDEIADLIRLAIAIGRIGTSSDAAGGRPAHAALRDYVRTFVSLDCNGLSGNYYGINPETSIEAYARPGRRRRDPHEVRTGDCLVTVTPAGRYKHIALIDAFTPGAGRSAQMSIAEWGQAGDEDKHYSTFTRDIVQGPNAQFGLGFRSGENFRYIFAPPANAQSDPRGYGLDGDETR